ncbi:MAG: redoxin domain-containing protein [Gemmatimonadota bacterium]|nr:redoxin domain-containing protein [Gemmatimonadota bacterium]
MNIGDTAYAFSLPAAKGEVVDVGALLGRGPVVLLFIPFAFSSVCTAELCRVGSEWPAWDIPDGHVFGVATDSPFVTAKWRADEGIPFPVLSDFGRAVSRAYGVLDENLMGPPGVAKRSAFVIDREGRVAYRWVSDDPSVEPDYSAVQAAVEAL